MRDILFKAKRKDNGEWVEGYYLHRKEHEILEISTKIIRDIDHETICQYTGLTDKNGNKIWENDVLSIAKQVDTASDNYYYPPIPYPVNVCVKWDMCAWMWETIEKRKHYLGFPDAWCHFEAEVIGNKFDNPELIGE